MGSRKSSMLLAQILVVASLVSYVNGISLTDARRRLASSDFQVADIHDCAPYAPISTCPPGLDSPCANVTCEANPAATCADIFCPALYRGHTLEPCTAAWYNETTGNIVDCEGTNSVDKITDCPAGSPRVMCTVEKSNPCANATCPGNPSATCISKVCSSTYQGQALAPCTAIWYDADTGDLVNCINRWRSPCYSCPTDYFPVCGEDGENYPNKCVADCLKRPIRKPGKCNSCEGDRCTTGRRRDLCVLGTTNQCWSEKYTCRQPEDGIRPGSILGRCLRYKSDGL